MTIIVFDVDRAMASSAFRDSSSSSWKVHFICNNKKKMSQSISNGFLPIFDSQNEFRESNKWKSKLKSFFLEVRPVVKMAKLSLFT